MEDFKAASMDMCSFIYIWINLHSPFTKLTFIITLLKFTILKLFVTIDLAVMAR